MSAFWKFEFDKKKKFLYGSATMIGIVGMFCIYKSFYGYKQRQLINYFRKQRRMISVGVPSDTLPSIRFMSYNILADGNRYCLGSNHDYVSMKYRKWNYRFPRIIAQINAYKPDIVCLQETTYETYNNSLKIEFDLMGYDSIHCIRDISSTKNGFSPQTETIIYNKNKFELINSKMIHANKVSSNSEYDKYFGDNNSYFRSIKLKSLQDVLIVLHLKLKSSRYQFVACSSHLYWNPSFTHIKLAQTLIFNHELSKLIQNEWNLDINTIPIVIGMDANVTPLKSKPDRHDWNISDNESIIPGVYQLMTKSKLSINHPHHPKNRIFTKVYTSIYYQKQREDKQNDDIDVMNDNMNIFDDDNKSEQDIILERQSIDISELVSTCVDTDKYPRLREIEYISETVDYTIDIQWKSVYHTANCEPIWTNHVPKFSDTIDYIFINDGWRVTSYLEMPYQRGLNYHLIDLDEMRNPTVHNNDNNNNDNSEIIKIEKEKEIENAKNFPVLPNENYPSDHMCLVTDLQFLPNKEEIDKLIKKLNN